MCETDIPVDEEYLDIKLDQIAYETFRRQSGQEPNIHQSLSGDFSQPGNQQALEDLYKIDPKKALEYYGRIKDPDFTLED